MAVLGVLILLFGLAALVLTPFAFFQIITKAGYSGWWTFVPYSPWIVAFLGAGVFRTVDTNRSIGSTIDELGLWWVLTVLSGVFVMIMFFVFAFSAWPSLQDSRLRRRSQPGWPNSGPGQPSWINAPLPAGPSELHAAAPPPPPAGIGPEANQAQPSGWYRSGAVGSGEQGYWDGQAWTARRQWKNGAWVDLPMPALSPVEAPTPGTN
jgi:hypothetical protein